MKLFDREKLVVRSANNRRSKTFAIDAKSGINGVKKQCFSQLENVVEHLRKKSLRIWFCGGHVFRAGAGWYLRDLMKRGFINHLALTGSGLVHDWELAFIGHTGEHVQENLKNGTFGMWEELSRINDVVRQGAVDNIGIGEACGRELSKRNSVIGAAHDNDIPITVHVAIGQDVLCQHNNYDGAAWGKCGYRDFLRLADDVDRIGKGTFLSFGSAVAAPEVFLKALAMARNVRIGTDKLGQPDGFTTVVFDCIPLSDDNVARYYNRPCKTLLNRVTSGNVYFVCGHHEDTIPNLWNLLCG